MTKTMRMMTTSDSDADADQTTPQQTPVHSVVAVICDILTPLSEEERFRALKGAAISLGVEVPINSYSSTPSICVKRPCSWNCSI